jgi:galactose oxidase-like protein
VGVSGPDATRALLVAPGATTHGADMNQRIVPLAVREPVPGKGLNLVAPEGPSSAPPGYYMLFVLKADGTPSVAKFVRLGADAPVAPVLGADPTPTPTPTATASPVPTPGPAADRRAPRAAATLRRTSRRLTLRLRLDEAGTARLLVRVGDRRVRRTLRFTRAHGLRELTIARPRKAVRLRVRITAADAAGNRRTSERAWRVPSRPR